MSAPSPHLREAPEVATADELARLSRADNWPRPAGWRLSPRAVVTYLCGGTLADGAVRPKYFGQRRLIEVAVATLATERALLLTGEPGTAKSWVSEHLAAAISGTSRQVVQGSAATTDEQLRYGWNYALLLSRGPVPEALVKSPVLGAMETGTLVRVEELTRCPAEVQDALVSILSEKAVAVPELSLHLPAVRGFNLIATANTRDRGVHELSAALRRRFNVVHLPVPASLELEVEIVTHRVAELAQRLELPSAPPDAALIRTVVQLFQELRRGQTLDARHSLKVPSSTLSTAEAIALFTDGMALAGHFGERQVTADQLALGLRAAVVRDEVRDAAAWSGYLETVAARSGPEWEALHAACLALG